MSDFESGAFNRALPTLLAFILPIASRNTELRTADPIVCLGLLVDLIGIEPMTSSMPWKRAPSCATGPLRVNSSILSDEGDQVKREWNKAAIAGV
jgi:hypothetical protein